MVSITYERTHEKTRMLTGGQIARAIRKAAKCAFENQPPISNIFDVLPANAATFAEYRKGATEAWFWNITNGIEGEKIKLPFPRLSGWYTLGKGAKKFGVPNGSVSSVSDPTALCLHRYENQDFYGPVAFGNIVDDVSGRGFGACLPWLEAPGVAFVGREATSSVVEIFKPRIFL